MYSAFTVCAVLLFSIAVSEELWGADARTIKTAGSDKEFVVQNRASNQQKATGQLRLRRSYLDNRVDTFAEPPSQFSPRNDDAFSKHFTDFTPRNDKAFSKPLDLAALHKHSGGSFPPHPLGLNEHNGDAFPMNPADFLQSGNHGNDKSEAAFDFDKPLDISFGSPLATLLSEEKQKPKNPLMEMSENLMDDFIIYLELRDSGKLRDCLRQPLF